MEDARAAAALLLAPYAREPALLAIAGASPAAINLQCRVPGCAPIDFFGALFCDRSEFQQRQHAGRADRNCACGR